MWIYLKVDEPIKLSLQALNAVITVVDVHLKRRWSSSSCRRTESSSPSVWTEDDRKTGVTETKSERMETLRELKASFCLRLAAEIIREHHSALQCHKPAAEGRSTFF